MTRPSGFPLLAIGLFAVACNDNSPTQPESATAPAAEGVSFAVASNSWITRADMPGVERQNMATGMVPNAQGQSILYAVGGRTMTGGSMSTVEAYNAATNVRNYRAQLPLPLYRSNGIGVIGGKLDHTGGLVSSQTPTRAFAGSTVLNNKLHIIGGSGRDPDGTFASAVTVNTVYDPATNTWVNKRSMPSDRVNIAASRVVEGGQARIEVVGGRRPGNNTQYIP